jgi:hypothetical protein
MAKELGNEDVELDAYADCVASIESTECFSFPLSSQGIMFGTGRSKSVTAWSSSSTAESEGFQVRMHLFTPGWGEGFRGAPRSARAVSGGRGYEFVPPLSLVEPLTQERRDVVLTMGGIAPGGREAIALNPFPLLAWLKVLFHLYASEFNFFFGD